MIAAVSIALGALLFLVSGQIDASADDPMNWVDFLTRAGLSGYAALTVWAFFTERIVPGTVHRRRIEEERARTGEWRIAFEGALSRIERALETLARSRP